jgi:hypothetical protein
VNCFRHRECRGELLITGNQRIISGTGNAEGGLPFTGNQRIISGTGNAEGNSSSQEISERFPAQGMQRGTPHHRK